MKRPLLKIVLASVLTLPVYVILANIRPVNDWFMDGRGWNAFEPWFRLWNFFGVYGNVPILIATMFAVSFGIALALIQALARIVFAVRAYRPDATTERQ